MNDIELDALAEGIFKFLIANTDEPRFAIAAIGIVLCKVYKAASDGTVPVATFAEDFKASFIESFNSASAQGTRTRQ